MRVSCSLRANSLIASPYESHSGDSYNMQHYKIIFEFDTAEEFHQIAEELFQASKKVLTTTNGLSIKNLSGEMVLVSK